MNNEPAASCPGHKRRRSSSEEGEVPLPVPKKVSNAATEGAELASSLQVREQRRAEVKAIYANYGDLLNGGDTGAEALAFQGLLECRRGKRKCICARSTQPDSGCSRGSAAIMHYESRSLLHAAAPGLSPLGGRGKPRCLRHLTGAPDTQPAPPRPLLLPANPPPPSTPVPTAPRGLRCS